MSQGGRRTRAENSSRSLFRLGLIASATALACSLALPSITRAAVTLGSNLATTPTTQFNCDADNQCTLSQHMLPAASSAPGGFVSPIDGVIVRWRIRVGNQTAPVTLRVTRPGTGFLRSGAGTGSTETPALDGTSTFGISPGLPIKTGDAIGLDCCSSGAGGLITIFAPTVNSAYRIWNPTLVNGAPPTGTFGLGSTEITMNADLEADSDGDGFGDETQDGCPTDASTQGGCPVPPKCLGKRATQTGSSKSETLKGTARADVIAGLGGKDTIRGLAGNDRLCGGKGNDLLIGGRGKDQLSGQRGGDILRGGPKPDVLKGGPGQDLLQDPQLARD